jgi:hypothetical protein
MKFAVDILLIDLCRRQDIGEVRAASMQLFAEQTTHDLPPTETISIEFRVHQKYSPLQVTFLDHPTYSFHRYR